MSCPNGECAKTVAVPISVEPTTLCSNEVYKNFKDAIVNINAIPKFSVNGVQITGGLGIPNVYSLTGPSAPVFSPTGPVIAPVLPLNYSGFLYEKDGYIVSSSVFLFAFFIALYYNNLFIANGGNYNLINSSVLVNVEVVLSIIFDPSNPRSLSDFFDFFVTVFNVNGCSRSYVYRAYVVGVDFDTGLAVYRIDPCDPWNKCCVPIRKHIFLKWGTSKCYGPGNAVHIIGSYSQQSPLAMASGTVVTNTDVITSGSITYEAILTDALVLNGVEGAPILDQCGYVVGVVTGRTGNVYGGSASDKLNSLLANSAPAATISQLGTAFGVTSSFACGIIERLIEADCRPGCTDFVIYNDIFGFNLYRHATLGINYYYRTGAEIGLYGADVVYPVDIERWYDPAYCEINRQIIGIIIKTAVTGPLAEAYEDCTTQQFPVFQGKTVITPSVDFVGFQVEPFDVITGLNGMPVGQLPSQITPETLLYQLKPCDTLTVEFLKAAESYTRCHALCTALGDSLAFLFNLPTTYGTGITPGSITSTQYQQILVWFFLSLSQVQRAYILSLFLNTNLNPNSLNGVPLLGPALLSALVQRQTSVLVDPFELNSTFNAPVVIPAIDYNLNYLGQIVSNTAYTSYFYNIINP